MSKENMFFDTEANLADQLQGALLQVKLTGASPAASWAPGEKNP